jgi:hypothetical protein
MLIQRQGRSTFDNDAKREILCEKVGIDWPQGNWLIVAQGNLSIVVHANWRIVTFGLVSEATLWLEFGNETSGYNASKRTERKTHRP